MPRSHHTWNISLKRKPSSLPRRSKRQAALEIAILIDANCNTEPVLHPKTPNVQPRKVCHRASGTNVVLVLGDMLIPSSDSFLCSVLQTLIRIYSEHERVVAYLRALDLEDYIGAYDGVRCWCLATRLRQQKDRKPLPTKAGTHVALSKTAVSNRKALALSTPTLSMCTLTLFVVIAGAVEHSSATMATTPANGPSRPTHLRLLALCRQGRVGVF